MLCALRLPIIIEAVRKPLQYFPPVVDRLKQQHAAIATYPDLR